MAGFQLAGPAADVSKSLYGENRKSYQSPNAQHDNSGFHRCPTVKCSNRVDGLERRAWQFYTIWDENQGLKVKIDEVTVDLVPRSGRPGAADRSSSA